MSKGSNPLVTTYPPFDPYRNQREQAEKLFAAGKIAQAAAICAAIDLAQALACRKALEQLSPAPGSLSKISAPELDFSLPSQPSPHPFIDTL